MQVVTRRYAVLCKRALLALAALTLSACATIQGENWQQAEIVASTQSGTPLIALPPAGQKVSVAVYGFTDQTGQFKPTDGTQTLSKAVTQGATSILMKGLHDAGRRGWFTVVEREQLDNLLRERAVIREMRASYLGEKRINPMALPALQFAGVLLEGGIIGYDSNTKSGGLGARFLGVGGRTQYRQDTVTVYLRAVSVKTGEVLSSVSVRKSIASVAAGIDGFRYVDFKELLEVESGITYNEPDALALQKAIEMAVYALIMEGSMLELWCMDTSRQQGQQLLTEYLARREGRPQEQVSIPLRAGGAPLAVSCQAQTAQRQQQKSQRLSERAPAPVPASELQPQPQVKQQASSAQNTPQPMPQQTQQQEQIILAEVKAPNRRKEHGVMP